jgi:N-acetylglucosaminyldiphosphoundecaprenol N-acetyl-beta-D-mannosaminyltransferase
VLWAAKRAGKPISERVSGVELTEELIKRGCAIFFLGAAPHVAEQAKAQMLVKYPHAQIVGTRDGFFSEAEEAAVVGEIARTKPQVLLVALGIPRQEKFLRKYMNTVGASVNMGVGGTFDVLSGNVRRAPKLMQNLRLEWLWRLILNPKKWKKVASLPEFWWRVVSSRRGSVAD